MHRWFMSILLCLGETSVDKTSVGEMNVGITSVDEMSIGEMSVGNTSVDKMR